MGYLPEALFRRLDRARLPRATLRRAAPAYATALRRLDAAHVAFRARGTVRPLAVEAQGLIDLLDAAFGLPPKRVLVRDRPRPHRRRGRRIVYEVHGQCEPDGLLEVYARTAARAQPVALLTLLNTLLHEWVHHHDFSRFRESVHCDGFYERLGQVYGPARDLLRADAIG